MTAAGISLEEAPIENPGSIGIVERYHAPLRAAFQKIRQTLSKRDADDSECLQMAVYSTNSTIGPEGLCPMLLVFGAIPRPARMTPSPSQLDRQKAIEEAKKEVEQEQSRRRIAFALRHPSNAKAKEQSAQLRDLPAGSPVLVYRTTTKRWEGPFTYITSSGDTAVVQLTRGRRIFRTNCVKPWVKSILGKDKARDESVQVTLDDGDEVDLGTEARKVKVKKGSAEERAFKQSRKDELDGLLKDGTFKPVHESTIKGSKRIFGSRFIDELKRAGDILKKKSRLVAQNYADEDATYIATKAPTVQRFSQRVALSLAASFPKMKTYTRDITQAYIQADS